MTGTESTASALVRLCTTEGVVPDAVGVLVRGDDDDRPLAVLTGWPSELAAGTPFGLALVSGGGAVRQWLRPVAVVHVYNVPNGDPARSVAVAVPEGVGPSTGVPVPPGVRNAVIAQLEGSHDVAGTLAEIIPDPYGALVVPVPALAIPVHEAAPQHFTKAQIEPHIGSAPAVTDGICQWLHWD
jgi:hypothetical protein